MGNIKNIKTVGIPFTVLKDGTETGFIGKIWNGLISNESVTEENLNNFCKNNEWLLLEVLKRRNNSGKIHTIRKKKLKKDGTVSTYWKDRIGYYARMYMWTGKPYCSKQFVFAPLREVLSVQEIKINYSDCDERNELPTITIDGKPFFHELAYGSFGEANLEKLVKSDGFDSVEDFFKWFNSDFEGYIIHWTDFKY